MQLCNQSNPECGKFHKTNQCHLKKKSGNHCGIKNNEEELQQSKSMCRSCLNLNLTITVKNWGDKSQNLNMDRVLEDIK